MKTIFTAGMLVLTLSAVLGQGSLTPPGPPAATMKSLAEIEPRINLQSAINPLPNSATYAIVIDTPGSYYLTANLSVSRPSAISITAPGVIIDLNGFSISRTSGATGDGINIAASANGCLIRNGSIKGFANGILDNGQGNGLRDLSVGGCSSFGIRTGQGATVDNCRLVGNSGSIALYALEGSSLNNCSATANSSVYGIFCEKGGTAINCNCSSNTCQYALGSNRGSTMINCVATLNTASVLPSAGFLGAGNLIGCNASLNSNTSATATNTAGMGFFSSGDGLSLKNCSAVQNKGDGIFVNGSCVVKDCFASGNGSSGNGAGVHANGSANLIEGNHVVGNDRGIHVDGTVNLVCGNTARGNTSNYEIVSGNRVGTIVVPPLSAAITGNGASAGFGSTDAWANIAF